MITRLVIFITSVMIMLSLSSCRGREGRSPEYKDAILEKEDMLRINQFLVGKDMELINAYIERRNWDVEFSKTGLGYQIYEHGKGTKVERGRIVTIEYSLSLLDGRVCYGSDEDGPKSFRVGQGGVEAGLEEGIQMMRVGDKARFILPPFLAHGLIGDQNKIPPRAVLIYEVEIINVSER